MLIRRDGLLVGQPAHAWVSGQLARAWSPAPSPWEAVCLAAEQHDVGWVDADLAPLLGPDGKPRSFLEYPRREHVAIWRSAARRMLAQSRYAALLVSLHGTSLYDRVDADAHPPDVGAEIADYLRGQRELQAELARGLDPAEVDRNRRLLLAWDRFSLALCHEQAATIAGVPDWGELSVAAPAAGIVAVAPWPFAVERVVAGCEARRLEGTFADAASLHAALAAAPWVPLRFTLTAG